MIGHERNHIGRANARMNSLLAGQIDQLSRLAHAAHRCLDHRGRLAGNRHHRAIVVRIHRPVQQMHSIPPHGGHNRLDPPGICAL